MWDYQAFLGELEDNFGPHDPVGDAEKAHNKLSMKNTTYIAKYNVDFWELASQVTWNETALCDRYFRRLLLRLHTEILHDGKPNSLADLRLKAQDADNIYWMQDDEAHSESEHLENIGTPNMQDFSEPPSPSTSSILSTSSMISMSSDSNKHHNSIADILDENGKLTGIERDRRMREGLCLYCGEKGHLVRDCSKLVAKAQATDFSASESNPDLTDFKN